MAYEVINLTARNGSIEITSGNHFEDDDFYVEATGALKVNESTDDVTVNVTPNEGYAFDHIEVDGDNLGNGYVSVDGNNGVATFHIRGLHDEAGSNYYGNTIVAVCEAVAPTDTGGDDDGGDAPAPDEPTPVIPADGDDQKQCTEAVRDYIVKRTGAENFSICYSKALNEYAGYEASGSQDFAGWFVDTYAEGESEYVQYIGGLLAEGFTHLDIMTVCKYDSDDMKRLEYTFNCIRNGEKTYGRYVEINGTTGAIGNKRNFFEFHLKGGFSGEKAVINGVSYYVVDVTENYGWYTHEVNVEIPTPIADENPLPTTTVREYCEPVCLIDDGRCYFKSRTTTNPDDMFIYIQGMWYSVGYIATVFLVTSDNYTIEYSGNDIITPAELVAQKVDEYSVRMSSMMSRLSAVLTERNGLRKAGKVLSSMDIAYKSMVDSIRDMLQ